MLCLLVTLLGAVSANSPVLAETFNNDSIIGLAAAGLGDAVLLAKIRDLPCAYDVSTEQIIRLKRSGVSNAVITAMVNRCAGATRAQGDGANSSDPAVKHGPGLYIQLTEGAESTLRIIRPVNAGGARVGGNGSLLFPSTATLAIPRPAAQTSASSNRPVFFFYFETDDGKTGDFGTSVSAAAQSPAEFSLIRFKVTADDREMTIGKATALKTTVGPDPKYTVSFSTSEIGDGIFRVEPDAELASGQYAFVLRVGSEAYRIYDFQVR